MAPRRVTPPRSLPAVNRSRALARARTCYDHLAGALGVAITEAMTHWGLLDWKQGLTLTGNGTNWLAELGIMLPPATASARPLVPGLDRTPSPGRCRRCRHVPSRLRLWLDHSDRRQPRRHSHRDRSARASGPPRPVRRDAHSHQMNTDPTRSDAAATRASRPRSQSFVTDPCSSRSTLNKG